jgi:AraC-like DNA-binding protein
MRAETTESPAMRARGDEVSNSRAPSTTNRRQYLIPRTSQRIGNLIRQAIALLENDHEAARRCLIDVWGLLASESSHLQPSTELVHQIFSPGGLARWQAKRALAYIEANLGSKISTRELADLVAFSKSHFSRAFKRSLGATPMAYVANRRVERAKVMMTSTREPLSEIALACGFADQSHLTRSFRRCVGMSPAIWRRLVTDRVDSNRPPVGPFSRGPRLWSDVEQRRNCQQADPARDADWNRGADLVQGLGHCNACHEPRNALGAPQPGANARQIPRFGERFCNERMRLP